MADVQVELNEEKREESGTNSTEAVLLRTGTKGAVRQQASEVSESGPLPQRVEIARRGPRELGAAGRPEKAFARGARRDSARREENNRPARGGMAGSRPAKRSAPLNRRKATDEVKRARGTTDRKGAWGAGEFTVSLLDQARLSHGNNVKLLFVDLAKPKKPRAQPVKKPRRLNWARQWAAEPEWQAPKEGS